jgi:hypothetical protein
VKGKVLKTTTSNAGKHIQLKAWNVRRKSPGKNYVANSVKLG